MDDDFYLGCRWRTWRKHIVCRRSRPSWTRGLRPESGTVGFSRLESCSAGNSSTKGHFYGKPLDPGSKVHRTTIPSAAVLFWSFTQTQYATCKISWMQAKAIIYLWVLLLLFWFSFLDSHYWPWKDHHSHKVLLPWAPPTTPTVRRFCGPDRVMRHFILVRNVSRSNMSQQDPPGFKLGICS